MSIFSWMKIFDPKLTLGLIIIIMYLFLIALLNTLGIYNTLISQNFENLPAQLLSVLVFLVPAYGMLKLKNWARLTEITISVCLVPLGFFLMLTYNLTFGILIIVPHGLIALYLLKTDCARIFKNSEK